MKQSQFLEVLDRDEAERALARGDSTSRGSAPRRSRSQSALGRVLADDVRAAIDVPGFDRSNMDGFAVRADDTFGATEEEPVRLRLHGRVDPDRRRAARRGRGAARRSPIATGGMLPRGADAVVPVEVHRPRDGDVRRGATRGGAGRRGLVRGHRHRRAARRCCSPARASRSRETGVLAAIGAHESRWCAGRASRSSRPATRSCSPARRCARASSTTATAASSPTPSRELGGEPWFLGAFRDDEAALRAALARALAGADLVLLSGGTSKGEGDLNARVVGELEPGHRRARRRAEAGQADLPRGSPRQARRDPARLSDLGDLHLPRVRGAGDPRDGAALGARTARDGARAARRADELRARAPRVPARRSRARATTASSRRTRWARAAAA